MLNCPNKSSSQTLVLFSLQQHTTHCLILIFGHLINWIIYWTRKKFGNQLQLYSYLLTSASQLLLRGPKVLPKMKFMVKFWIILQNNGTFIGGVDSRSVVSTQSFGQQPSTSIGSCMYYVHVLLASSTGPQVCAHTQVPRVYVNCIQCEKRLLIYITSKKITSQ